MNERDRLQDALEAGGGHCQPVDQDALSDLLERVQSDPEWAQLADQVHHFDSQLRKRLADVPIPPHLEALVRQRLAESEAADSAPTWKTVGVDAEVTSSQAKPIVEVASRSARQAQSSLPKSPQPPISRRRVLLRWATLTAAACLGMLWLGGALKWIATPKLTQQAVIDDAMQWLRQLDDSTAWQPIDGPANDRYPPSPSIAGPPRRSAKLATPWDAQTRLYDYSGGGRVEQWCFVIRPRRGADRLATLPPAQPMGGTGGWNAVCWQEGPAVYVLLVRGSLDDYRRAVAPGRRYI